MLTVNKTLKDEVKDLGLNIKDKNTPIGYTKTNKLVIALYMVTDMLEKDEPLRNKLRTLGSEIVSDIYNNRANTCNKISETVSFLDIATSLNLISEMNSNILKKEFSLLDQAIKNSLEEVLTSKKHIDITDFFNEETEGIPVVSFNKNPSIGQKTFTRIGVQKGSTLMKALSEKTAFLSLNSKNISTQNFDLIKKNRREHITKTIKLIGGNATIKDIKSRINEVSGTSVEYSEKTLQRELVSMIKDGVLDKTGEKRWSKYFIKN